MSSIPSTDNYPKVSMGSPTYHGTRTPSPRQKTRTTVLTIAFFFRSGTALTFFSLRCVPQRLYYVLARCNALTREQQVVYNIMCEEIIPSCLTTNPKNAHDKDFHGTLRDAVKTWRIPYWDWAATDDLPPIVKLITVEIDIKKVPSVADVPSGHMFNPLNKFEMPSKEPMGAWGIQAIPEDNEKTKWRPVSIVSS